MMIPCGSSSTHIPVSGWSGDGRVLVIDPGIWSEPGALRGADAVLVTHEHSDHVDAHRLAGLGVPVYAPTRASIPGLATQPLTAGESREVAGFAVRAIGADHAKIHNGLPDCAHLAYLVDGVYHPGDSVHRPAEPVRTLFVPVHGSWLKMHEAIDFVQAVAPDRAIGIHEGQLNQRGLEGVNGWLAETNPQYRYLEPGESVQAE
jgi:L-ascorbate metabolism protein UlaG (beta-lactamase superfamily)